jgi:hypothetical protein
LVSEIRISQFNALVILAQIQIFPDGRPDRFHEGPVQELVALLGNAAVPGLGTGRVGGRYQSRLGGELFGIGKTLYAVDLACYQGGEKYPETGHALEELGIRICFENTEDQLIRFMHPRPHVIQEFEILL